MKIDLRNRDLDSFVTMTNSYGKMIDFLDEETVVEEIQMKTVSDITSLQNYFELAEPNQFAETVYIVENPATVLVGEYDCGLFIDTHQLQFDNDDGTFPIEVFYIERMT